MQILRKRLEVACREAPAGDVAIYVEEVKSGFSTGINANERFIAASLIKLPVMGAAYEYWEAHPERKTQRERTWMEGMITVSDNTSTDRLIQMVGGPERVTRFCETRGWENFKVRHAIFNHQGRTGKNECTARDVGRFLAALARRELVNMTADQEMWEVLTRSKKLQRIPAGIPKQSGVKVGNKTGTLSYVLHDSAIVRTPRAHYALCILQNRYRSEQAGNQFCRRISRLVFNTMQDPTFPPDPPAPIQREARVKGAEVKSVAMKETAAKKPPVKSPGLQRR